MVAWSPGEQKVGPGVFIRTSTFGQQPSAGLVDGVAAAVVRADWGPLAQVYEITSLSQVDEVYGTGLGTDAIREALYGGARSVMVSRVGTGGTRGSLTLQDTAGTPANVAVLNAKYIGPRDIRVTIRDTLADPTGTRELLIYERVSGVDTLRQTVRFAKGAGNGGEAQKLVTALNAVSSQWLTATFTATGNGVLAQIGSPVPVQVTGGTAPAVLSADYTAAFSPLEGAEWNCVTLDTNDTTIHASAVAFIDRIRSLGLRRMLSIGEPTSVALATRQSDARAYNNEAITYWGNGFITIDGNTREGWSAAARAAGIICSTPYYRSITRLPVRNVTTVVGELTQDQQTASINAGMSFFSTAPTGVVRVHYGITTFTTPTADKDLGWSKIRRVRTRDYLLNRIENEWDPLMGQINNDPDGRATLRQRAQGVINEMISLGALLQGECRDDAARPPVGDSAWFEVLVDDIDSGEKLYLTALFRFAPPA